MRVLSNFQVLSEETSDSSAFLNTMYLYVVNCEQDTQHNTRQERTQPTNSDTHAHQGTYILTT
jgi:hypothetical protein